MQKDLNNVRYIPEIILKVYDMASDKISKMYIEELQDIKERLISFKYVLPYIKDKKVLDLGCANGKYLEALSMESVGVDISNPNIDECKKKGLNVIKADINRLFLDEFETSSFEGIFCSHILEHVNSPIDLLRECHRILKEEGVFVLGLPIEGGIIKLKDHYFKNHKGHLYSFSLDNIAALLEKTDFEVVKIYFELPLFTRLKLPQFLLDQLQKLPNPILYKLCWAYWIIARKIKL